MANGQRRSGGIMDGIGLIAGLSVLAGPLLGWLRIGPPRVAFYFFMLGGLVAVIAALTALVSAARGRGFGVGRTVALVAAMVFVFTAFRAGGGASMINDYTTSLDDPPAFRHAASLGPNVGRDLAYPAEFAEVQRGCCADLKPVRIDAPPTEALRRAEATARAMPTWTVTEVDATGGTVEATSESAVFGFVDDVVIRVRPDGSGSVIDVRSKSRDGRGDMGVNAARIRAYVAALEASGSKAG